MIEGPLYHLHSLGAAGGGGLARLQQWLDHVAGLGCGGVLLTPIFESSSHGYDTIDPFRIDPRLGDDTDFDAFVGACHERDLALVLDGVFNHVGRGFAAPSPDWFSGNTFEGHHELPALDHHNPEVLRWAVAVARHWLERGADGWRFDAAYAIRSAFLRDLASSIRETHRDAYLFGEVIHGDYAGFVAATGLDAVTQYELHKAIWSSLHDANLFELAWALKRHRAFAESFAPVTFVGNHDVTRLASLVGDARHLGAALAVLFTVPGVPCVYYGDELGWRGVKEHRAGGDDAIRPPLPDRPEPDDAEVLALHRELIAFRRARPWLRTATLEVESVANRALTYRVTGGEGEQVTVTVDLDRGDRPFTVG
jgi:cyclomaltodextrinase